MSETKQSYLRMSNNNSPILSNKTFKQIETVSPYIKRFLKQERTNSTYKKTEEKQRNERIRQLETKNIIIDENLHNLQRLNKGLQDTMKERINMYKQIIEEKDRKFQSTISNLKTEYIMEIQQLSQQKEAQIDKLLHEIGSRDRKIQQLLYTRTQFEQRTRNQTTTQASLKSQIQRLITQNQGLKDNYLYIEKEKNIQIGKHEENIRQMNLEWKDDKSNFKKDIQALTLLKNNEIRQLQERLQYEVRRLEDTILSQNNTKNHEITELKRIIEIQKLKFQHTLEAQRLRYDHLLETDELRNQKSIDEQQKKKIELVHTKQNTIDMLSRDVEQFKRSLFQVENENSKLKVIIQDVRNENKSLIFELKECDELFIKQKADFLNMIHQLREEIRLNQVNYVREKDRSEAVIGENMRLQYVSNDRKSLLDQINDLRKLLLQSSEQIQICRQKFVFFQRQNKKLRFQMERMGSQNSSLLHLRRELQQQAIKWRQNYLRLTH